ncbi:hypothetical protein [Simplicispira metamorpha]|uniref:hypothetical protein n=1 Tax=Simplicispira metamorpha TaxID=80881 RepID=UPI0010485980|nr:hypothetical protein [Simplicispira metamorpha]
MKRILILLLAVIAAILVIYILLRGIGSFSHGYYWKEMDWNNDGETTIVEFFEASDIGRRDVVVDGKPCIENFSFKDGLAVRIDCSDAKEQGQKNR